MKARVLGAVAALLFPAVALAQSSRPATYITAEQVKTVNALPGVDRQIVNVDVGNTNLAVGVIHRGKTGAPPAAAPVAAAAGGGAAAAAQAAPPEPCGEKGTVPAGSSTGLWHQGQTETYLIISGSGTLVTGGKVFNGRKSRPDQRSDQGPQRSVVQRLDRRRRRRQARRQRRRHHHHPGGHAARLGGDPRSRRLPQRASGSAAHDSGALHESGAEEAVVRTEPERLVPG